MDLLKWLKVGRKNRKKNKPAEGTPRGERNVQAKSEKKLSVEKEHEKFMQAKRDNAKLIFKDQKYLNQFNIAPKKNK